MRELIPGVPFCDCNYYRCEQVALDSILRFYGYVTPLVMHDQWFFLYQRQGRDESQIHARFTPLLQSLCQCGIQVEVCQEPDAGVAWKRAKSQIDGGHPVPVVVDPFPLEAYYFPGRGRPSVHSVILAGYEDGPETVHVIDPSPSKLFRGDLPLSGLMSAWGSEHIQRYTWMNLHFSQPRWTLTEEQAIQTLQRNLHLMVQAKTPLPGTYVGLQGMKTLVDDLPQFRDLEGDASWHHSKRLFGQFRPIVIEREGHSKYLSLVADKLNEPGLAQVCNQLRQITQKWVVFRNLCSKAQKKASREAFEKLPGRLLEIVSLEEGALNCLQALVG